MRHADAIEAAMGGILLGFRSNSYTCNLKYNFKHVVNVCYGLLPAKRRRVGSHKARLFAYCFLTPGRIFLIWYRIDRLEFRRTKFWGTLCHHVRHAVRIEEPGPWRLGKKHPSRLAGVPVHTFDFRTSGSINWLAEMIGDETKRETHTMRNEGETREYYT